MFSYIVAFALVARQLPFNAPTYQEALQKSGYKYALKYQTQGTTQNHDTQGRKRKRKITWFNPPFSANVTTNIGQKFLKLIDRSFPTDHQLHKLINRNTIRVSYKCMPNMNQIISSHNKSIIRKKNTSNSNNSTNNCNCRNKNTCPLNGNCLANGIVYQYDNHT